METNGIGILLLGWSGRLFARILSGGKSALEAAGAAIIYMVADRDNQKMCWMAHLISIETNRWRTME